MRLSSPDELMVQYVGVKGGQAPPKRGQVKTDQGTGTRAGASPAPTIHEQA